MTATYYNFPPESIFPSLVTTIDNVREPKKNRNGIWIKDSEGRFQFIQTSREGLTISPLTF